MPTHDDELAEIRFVLSALGVAMNALESLRPLHFGLDVDHTHRHPTKLDGLTEHLTKEALVILPMLAKELEKEAAKRELQPADPTKPPAVEVDNKVHVPCGTCGKQYTIDRDKTIGRLAQWSCSHCGAVIGVRDGKVVMTKPGKVGTLSRCPSATTKDPSTP